MVNSEAFDDEGKLSVWIAACCSFSASPQNQIPNSLEIASNNSIAGASEKHGLQFEYIMRQSIRSVAM